jgi:uncharacterized protein
MNQPAEPLEGSLSVCPTPNGMAVNPEEAIDARGTPVTYRFGPYLIDANRRMLHAGSTARPLTEKLFQVLALLLEADGGIVAKDAFFARIWPNDPSEANLAQHVFLLRSVLGESARDHSFIVTVPGKGYKLAAPVEKKVGLTMRSACEACSVALAGDAAAFICSYECTFCPSCSDARERVCTNCGGELVVRPRR